MYNIVDNKKEYMKTYSSPFSGILITNLQNKQLSVDSRAPMSQSWVQIPIKSEFFHALIFTTALVVCIAVMIYHGR